MLSFLHSDSLNNKIVYALHEKYFNCDYKRKFINCNCVNFNCHI